MDEHLKQRLVGAMVLVGLAVVFIPMLLRSPPDAPARSAAPSSVERPGFSSSVVPLDEAPAAGQAAPAMQARPEPAAPAPRPAPSPAPPEPPRAPAPPQPAVTAAPPASVPATPTPASPGWVIQLGSFSNASNARALTDRLSAKGYSAFTRAVESARGPVTRVYVGPSASRDEANAVVEKLLRETNLRGIVVRAASG